MYLWDFLLQQCDYTLNMTRTSRLNPALSAYHHLYGQCDFDVTPMVPPGTKVLMYNTPQTRGSWDPHGEDGWYIGLALKHYRCYHYYCTKTNSTRYVDTVEFFPTVVQLQHPLSIHIATQAAIDLSQALTHPSPVTPFARYGDGQLHAIHLLNDLFQQALPPALVSSKKIKSPTADLQALVQKKAQVISQDHVRDLEVMTTKSHNTIGKESSVSHPNQDTADDSDLSSGVDSSLVLPPQLSEPVIVRITDLTSNIVTVRRPDGDFSVVSTPTLPAPVIVRLQDPVIKVPKEPPPNLRRSQRILKKFFLTRREVNFLHPCLLPRVNNSISTNVARAPRVTPPVALPLFNAVTHPVTGAQCEYRHLSNGQDRGQCPIVWISSFANELGRLVQGVGNRISGTNTIHFIPFSLVPYNKHPIYDRIVSDIRPHKQEVERIRLTVNGDTISCPYDINTAVADLTTVKIYFNSVISTPSARFMEADIRNFYLNNDIPPPEYMRLPIKIIPLEIIKEYNLLPLVHNDFIYIHIDKSMYGLPQARKIAHDALIQHLCPFGYHPTSNIPGLWVHDTKPLSFVLTVDDFGIKYRNISDAKHLLTSLGKKYEFSTDWKGLSTVGLLLDGIISTQQFSSPC